MLALCFLLGCIAGLRSLTAPAVVCWAAHLGWINFSGTKLALIGWPLTLVLVTFLAVVELIADKLPRTPARTAPIGLGARIFLGAASAIALAVSVGASSVLAGVAGIVGALIGTYAGYNVRHTLVTRGHLPDYAVALAEDAIAIAGGMLIVSRF